ncbi:MAG: outer membrane protein [Pseudolabrys sp.]
MRRFVWIAAVAALVWSVPAWAIIGETSIKVTDGGQPVPTATVTLTFKDKDGKPVGKPVKRPVTRTGTPKIKIPDNTTTVDITVSTPRQTVRRNSIDVSLLTDKDFTIDVPGGGQPPSRTNQPRDASTPMSPPLDPTGPIIGLGAGVQDKSCPSTQTILVETLGIIDPLGPDPFGCSTTGFRGSVFLGYSRRVGTNFLIGVEGDIGLVNKTGTINGIPGSVGNGVTTGIPGLTAAASLNDSVSTKRSWDASLRARFGYFVTPRAVIYATGGLAMQRVTTTVTCSVAGACAPAIGPTPFTASHSDTMTGWTLGGGLEYALTERLSLRGEYRYADLGTFRAVYGTAANAAFTIDTKMQTHTYMVGLGFKFGDVR